MEIGSIVVLAAVLYWLGSYIVRKNREQSHPKGRPDEMTGIGASQPLTQLPVRLSLVSRIRVGLRSFFSSRYLESHETSVSFLEESSEIQVAFYVARKPIRIELYVPSSFNLQVADLTVSTEGESRSVHYGIGYDYLGDRLKISISVSPAVLVRVIRIALENCEDQLPHEVHVRVDGDQYADHVISKAAWNFFDAGQWKESLSRCQEYLTYCSHNPLMHYLMAQTYLKLKNHEKAGEHALKSAVNGFGEKGCDLYRETIGPRSFVDLSHIKDLQKDYCEWDLETQHGVVALERAQQYLLGLDGWYLKKYREILTIRRPVAARMLTRVGFHFSSNDRVLFSSLRVIGEDHQVEELPLEQFTMIDSDEKNPYIMTLDERTGCWILPDLSAGDVIEWSYYLLCPERHATDGNKPHLFIRTYLHHSIHPTLLGKAEFVSPTNMELAFSCLNDRTDVSESDSEEESQRMKSLSLRKYIPVTNTDYQYANNLLNPVIGCSVAGHTWDEVKQIIAQHNVGSLDPEPELPAPLCDILNSSPDPKVAMERAFYWIRDKLKYAAVGRALKWIGQPGRAKAIIESGVGDCKDKSYLVYQCCRKLGLAANYVAISAESGVIFEELPSDQFSHVFVKVIIDGRSYYLDAAGSTSIFSSAPPGYQGLRVLLLDGEELLETIPVDDPYDNILEITEMFDRDESDWLCGSFNMKAQGCLARLIDEKWKAMSLQMTDQALAAQSVLKMFMPSLLMETYQRTSQTSQSEVFEVSGTHRRCHLSLLGERKIGTLNWEEPAFPVGAHGSHQLESLFAFYVPEAIKIETVIMDPLLSRFEGFSEPVQASNDICDIRIESVSKNNALVMSREIIIKKKVIGKELIHLMPDVLENLERAMQVALSLRP